MGNKAITRSIILLGMPSTAKVISLKSGLSYSCVTANIKNMRDEGLIHICDWEYNPSSKKRTNAYAPVYANGTGINKEKPKPKTSSERNKIYIDKLKSDASEYRKSLDRRNYKRSSKFRSLNVKPQFKQMEHGLPLKLIIKSFPGTTSEISKKSGVNRATTNNVVRKLKEKNEIYVYKWVLVGKKYTALYAKGKRIDAEKPKRKDASVYRERYKNKLKKEFGAIEYKRMVSEKHKALRLAKKASSIQNDWLGPIKGI